LLTLGGEQPGGGRSDRAGADDVQGHGGGTTSLGVERMDSLYVDTESTRWATDFGLS
jgi:hypothetical protein